MYYKGASINNGGIGLGLGKVLGLKLGLRVGGRRVSGVDDYLGGCVEVWRDIYLISVGRVKVYIGG